MNCPICKKPFLEDLNDRSGCQGHETSERVKKFLPERERSDKGFKRNDLRKSYR